MHPCTQFPWEKVDIWGSHIIKGLPDSFISTPTFFLRPLSFNIGHYHIWSIGMCSRFQQNRELIPIDHIWSMTSLRILSPVFTSLDPLINNKFTSGDFSKCVCVFFLILFFWGWVIRGTHITVYPFPLEVGGYLGFQYFKGAFKITL